VPAPSKADKKPDPKNSIGMISSNAVDAYLRFLNDDSVRPTGGRKIDLVALETKIQETARFNQKVILIAQLHRERSRGEWDAKEAELRAVFLEHAVWFSNEHNIGYAAWREIGVPVTVLKEAGIS
jgi:hypothetical protein